MTQTKQLDKYKVFFLKPKHKKGIPPHIKTVGTLLHKNSLPVIVPQTYELGVIAKVKELFPGTFLLFAG